MENNNPNPMGFTPLDFSSVTPQENLQRQQLQSVGTAIKASYSEDYLKLLNKASGNDPFKDFEDKRVKFKDYTTSFDAVYAPLSDNNSFVARYESYLPNVNNEERLARQQSAGEQWANGFSKLGLKTLTAVGGGTVGIVDSLVTGIKEGSLSAAYNSDFNKWLDDLNTKMDYKLPNYYTEEDRNKSFFSQMGTVNFWADKVFGGLSFTIGAIGSEAIWASVTGGTSLLAKGLGGGLARFSSRAMTPAATREAMAAWKGIATAPIIDATNAANFAESAIRGANIAKALDTGRFLVTSSGYEAGVEARQYMKQTEVDWLENFENTNGRQPDASELAGFRDKLTSAGNVVFAANVGIVGLSNMLTIGKLVRGKSISPDVNNGWMNRNLFGIGFTQTEGAGIRAIEATTKQKLAGRAYGLLKVGATEGVFEEGMQGVASRSAQDYILSAYDENKIKQGYNIIDSIAHGFKESYGSKEGLEEVGIGVLVGLIGGGGTSLASGKGLFNEKGVERDIVQQRVEYYNQFHADNLIEAQKTLAKVSAASERSDVAKANGDLFGEVRADTDVMLASIERSHQLLDLDRTKQQYATALNTVNNEEFAKEMGIPVEEVQAWKESKLEQFNTLVDNYDKGTKVAQAYLGDFQIKEIGDKENVARAIAYTYASGMQSQQAEKDLTETISKLVGEEFGQGKFESTIQADLLLDKVDKQTLIEFERLSKSEQVLMTREKKITEQTVATPTSREDNQKKATKAENVRRQLLEVTDQLAEVRGKKQALSEVINLNNTSNLPLTVETLDRQKGNLEQLKRALESLKETNPHKYALINNLITAQSKAIESTKSFDNMFRDLADPKNRVTVVRGFLDKLLKARQGKDDYTFFSDIAKTYDERDEQFIEKVPTQEEDTDRVELAEEETQQQEINAETVFEELKTTESVNRRQELLKQLEELNIIKLKC